MRYIKVIPTPDGGSRFEDAEFVQEERVIGENIPPLLVAAPVPASAAIFVTAPEAVNDIEFHQAPTRQFVVCLSGELEAETTDGERRRFTPGMVGLVEDTTGRGHITRIVKHPASFLMIPLA